jgi:hypothetical protein
LGKLSKYAPKSAMSAGVKMAAIGIMTGLERLPVLKLFSCSAM